MADKRAASEDENTWEKRVKVSAEENEFYNYIDNHEEQYVDRLREAVGIQSVSAWPDKRHEIDKMMEWTKQWIEKLGGSALLKPNPVPFDDDGGEGVNLKNPPILLGTFGNDPSKRTICVYGHLDVQPALLADGWNTEPFELTEVNGALYGRGASDDKGPALSWLWVVEALKALGRELPVNIKMIYEGLEEYGSAGMHECILQEAKKGNFLADVDYFCISDNYWVGKHVPCLTYGLRGMSYVEVGVQCSTKDLHSGVYGGSVHEAMTDLTKLMASLVAVDGKILIPGVYDDVDPLTDREAAIYPTIDFDIESYKKDTGVTGVSNKLLKDNKEELLMSRWREPTLSLHGIEGAFYEPGAKTVIPRYVRGKFSLRLVPFQDPVKINEQIKTHLETKFKELKSPNKMNIVFHHAAKAWKSDPDHPNYLAGRKAVQRVFGREPDLTREGGSIPIANMFEDITGMSVLLLPVGACDDGAHSQNEKFDRLNYMNGIKVLGTYIYEIAALKGPKPSSCRCIPDDATMAMVGGFARGFRCKCEM
jgi:nonspecific dipeptidase